MPLSEQEFADQDDNILFRSIKMKDWNYVRELLSITTTVTTTTVTTPTTAPSATDETTNNNSNAVMLLKELDIYENTALHAAIGYQAPDDILLTLLDQYPDATRIHGANAWLPLHVAAMWGASPRVMTALIEQYPQALDDRGEGGIKGRTPRHFRDRLPHNKELLERSTEEWIQWSRERTNSKSIG